MAAPLRLTLATHDEAQADSISAAKHAAALERAQFTALTGVALDDDGRIGVQIANAIVAAVYGPRGEWR